MSRPIRAWIHLDALSHNLGIARRHAKNSKVYAVVKANAYGHGIERVYPALQQADGFALLDLAEAKRLRALGWQGDILLLEGIFSAQDLQDCHDFNFSFTVHNTAQIEWLQQFQSNHPHSAISYFCQNECRHESARLCTRRLCSGLEVFA